MSATVYLDGRFLASAEAKVSVFDRGFLFGDAAYEVIPVYGGRVFRPAQHFERLRASLGVLGMESPLDDAGWEAVIAQLLAGAGPGEQSVYVHVSRGVDEGREAVHFAGLRPTVLVTVSPVTLDRAALRRGIRAVLLEDTRWHNCHVKSTSLLGNLLLRRRALESGAAEALLHRDGELTEGTSSNVFAVLGGVLRTAPADRRILRGITRDVVVELAGSCGIALEERALGVTEAAQAEELFICSSTREIVPVTGLDGRTVGDGAPGALTRRLMDAFDAFKQAFAEAA
jgi:D-alanine transaminase